MFTRRKQPAPDEAVLTSTQVLDRGSRVTRVHRLESGTWMYLAARDDAQPTWAHYSHLAEQDLSLQFVHLRKGEYALRTHTGIKWHVFGPVDDETLDQLLDAGVIDEQQTALEAREV